MKGGSMIGVNRRRVMGGVSEQYDENSYIQDGLVFQIDGINKGGNLGYWTDLKGGCMFQVPEDEGLIEGTDCYTWSANVNMPLSSGVIPQGTGCTVEIAMFNTIPNSTMKWGVFASSLDNGAGNIFIGVFNNIQLNFINRCAMAKYADLVKNSFTTMSYCSLRACIDETEVSLGSADYLTAHRVGIGFVYNSGMRGSIYAIRIYDRQLALSEMKYNQMVDRKRFG